MNYLTSRLNAFFIGILCILQFSLQAYSEPLSYITIFNTPKYPKTFTHFSYANPDAPQGGSLFLGAHGTFDSFYPFFIKGTSVSGISPLHDSLVFATLFKHSEEELDVAYAYIAEKIDINKDRTEITFFLRKNAVFQDNSPIRPEDVIFSFNFLLNKGLPLYKSYYRAVDQVKKTGDHQVTFFIKPGAAREIPIIISEIPILSEKFFTSHDVEKNLLIPPIGSGPYRVSDFQPGRFVRYEKVENWWAKDVPALKGAFNFRFITYEYFSDTSALFEAFKSGEIDFRSEGIAKNWENSYDFPAVQQGKIKKETYLHHMPFSYQPFILNLRNPLFQDLRVRKAIEIVFDFDWLNKTLFFNRYQRSLSFFGNTPFAAKSVPSEEEKQVLESWKNQMSKEFSHYIPEEIFTTPIEDFTVFKLPPKEKIKLALGLLQQAGWNLKNGKLYHPKHGFFKFTFLLKDQSNEKISQNFKRMLVPLGMHVDIRYVDPSQYINNLQNFKFDATRIPMTGSAIPGYELKGDFGSAAAKIPGSHNIAGIQNPFIDQLIEKIVKAHTLKEIVLYSHILDRLLFSNYYTIPGWTCPSVWFAYWDRFGKPKEKPNDGIGLFYWWEKKPK